MSIIHVPTPDEAETVPLSLAVTALGYSSHQKAFHQVRNGTFPIPTQKDGTRVRVNTAELRKTLKLRKGETKYTAPKADAKQVRKAPEKANPQPVKAAATKAAAAPAKETPSKAAAAVKRLADRAAAQQAQAQAAKKANGSSRKAAAARPSRTASKVVPITKATNKSA